MATKVYIQNLNDVKVNNQIIGWDKQANMLVKTTPIQSLSQNPDGTIYAKTEHGGEYVITNSR